MVMKRSGAGRYSYLTHYFGTKTMNYEWLVVGVLK